jgi:hypothetical protein
MVGRIISTVALAACAGLYAYAAERATFVLTDGSRKSGEVVFHTPARENLINGNLNLGVGNGKEETFGADQVAVIDFAGGQPGSNELQALPASGHLLALRDGKTEQGHFVNLIGGDTVRWQDRSGESRDIPISQVGRIYLNPQAARTAFNYSGPPAATAVATSGTLEPGAVRVEANQAWNDSGISVKKGDRVSFRATGQIAFGEGPGMTAGPDGNGNLRQTTYPVPVMPVGGLIGKVGNSAPFPIGSNTQPIVMPADGRLMIGVNDNEIGDNSGFFSVVVRKQ